MEVKDKMKNHILQTFLFFFVFFYFSLNAQETTFLLIRHGQTQWNVLDLIQGQTDIPLNEYGKYQADLLSKILMDKHSDIDLIYSSDLLRALGTAERLSQELKLSISKSSSLRELHFGIAQGMTAQVMQEIYGRDSLELDNKYPKRKDRWKVTEIPGGETYSECMQRFRSFLEKLGKQEEGKKIAVFTHGTLMEIFVADLCDSCKLKELSNCAIIELLCSFDYATNSFRIINIEDPLKEL